MITDVNVELNTQSILNKVSAAKEKAQFILDQQVLKDANYYVPVDTHTLQKSGIINSKLGEGILVWNTPYARRLYYGENYNFSTDKNRDAGPLWFERSKRVHLKSWLNVAKAAFSKSFKN